MLSIQQISVKNFRSIRDECFILQPLTMLVGKNDVGKSNLLEAIRILFEGTATSVDAEDFYDVRTPIEIIATLQGAANYLQLCDAGSRTKIEQRIAADGVLTIRRVADTPRKLGAVEILDPKTGDFKTPTGIDAAIRPMLPEPIFIEALADVADQTKGTQKDALGRLIGQVVSSISDQVQPSLDQAYAAANKLLNVQLTVGNGGREIDERARELVAIEEDVTKYLKETFPQTSVRLKMDLPSVKSILGNINVLVKEGTHQDPYYRRGHGLQRALYLSLLRALAARIREGKAGAVVRPFMLLYEEPEAFLHPEGQIKMRNALQAIATRAQVVMATHSPVMVTADCVPQTVRVEKRREAGLPKPITKRFGPIQQETLTEHQRQLLPLFAIQRSARFLFSRGVLLVEGVGDEYIFSAIAEQLRKFNLEAHEIAIVESGGKDKLVAFREILEKLGLQTWILTDIDFLWNGAGTALGADADLARFVERLNQLVPLPPEHERSEGRLRERKHQMKQECIAQLAAERNTLCERLQGSGIFVLREGEIEDYVGLGHTSKGQYLKAAEEIRAGNRPIHHQDDFVRLLDAFQQWAA